MTEIDKANVPTKFLWVDLEMTGLDVQQDVIIEVAAIVTDANFKPLARYEALVQQSQQLIESRMNADEWWGGYAENRAEFFAKNPTATPAARVERELIDFVKDNFGDEPAVLAGNSIHNDRNFIKQAWPTFDARLHYRMLDISAWKVLMQARYGVEFQKQNLHRALDDIEASIAELQYYVDWFAQHKAFV